MVTKEEVQLVSSCGLTEVHSLTKARHFLVPVPLLHCSHRYDKTIVVQRISSRRLLVDSVTKLVARVIS